MRARGTITPEAMLAANAAGVSQSEIVEVIVAGTDIDFPVVRAADLVPV